MNILSEAKQLIDNLDKVKDQLGLSKVSTNQSLFKEMEIRKNSLKDTYLGANSLSSEPLISKIAPTKTKKLAFRVTYLKSVMQFLDLNSMLNISLVSKEFYYFIKSIYFFKFVSDGREANNRIKKRKSQILNRATETRNIKHAEDSSLIGKLSGALSYFCMI
jgi:hypothetical protein